MPKPSDIGMSVADVPFAPPEIQEFLAEGPKPTHKGKFKVKSTYIFVPFRPTKFQKEKPLDVAAFMVNEIITHQDAVDAGVPTGKNLKTDDPMQHPIDEFDRWIESGAIELLEGTTQ